jgi:EAL domain-containing protein (putative c-di-GMP-specific phosphodiesterase class I)/CHASE2 domain-containing sensor protein
MGGIGSWLPRLFRKGDKRENSRVRLLAWATLAGLIFGAIDFGEPLENHLRIARNWVRQHDASGDIVVIGVDERSLDRIGKWPWPRHYHGELTDNLRRLGARKIVFDLIFSARSDPKEDQAFAAALERSKGEVILPTRFMLDPVTGKRTDNIPLPEFRKHSSLTNVNFLYNGWGHVWELPYSVTIGGSNYPSLASVLAGTSGPSDQTFPVDYAVDPTSVPVVSAVDIINGTTPASVIRGKDVVIATTSLDLGDVYFVPGHQRMAGVYLHVLGAETLKAGVPSKLGWLIPFLAALALAACSAWMRNGRIAAALMCTGGVTFLLLPILLEQHRLAVQITPALFLLMIVGGSLAWSNFRRSYRLRGTVNAISGLPNLNALRQETEHVERPLIAARIQNYAEITSALPPQDEKSLVQQIAGRLTLGAAGLKLYHGDEGIFAWFGELSGAAVGDHLDALHQLFRSPLSVAGNQLDLSITFGFDDGGGRSLSNRLGSALVAADEAAAEGLRWKLYDSAKLKDASWKLSLLSQLDAAIDAEELWVAYQPKFDIVARKVVGAEALVRWTHAEKGPISPIEFVMAAEQSDRIDKLTTYVMERAIAAAAQVNARGIAFDLSVNLSARLIDNPALPKNVMALLQKYGLPPEQLTLEVTETAALNTNASNLETLLELRYLGVQISIDDYGTGLSTLDYLKRIPATEIKIDKSFVQALEKSRSDRLLVHSTIQLAHSLGQRVVAEGVEDQDTLNALAAMECDVAQGYFIGKPMEFKALLKQLMQERKQRAA